MERELSSATVRRRYDRLARWYDTIESPMERMAMERWRRALIAHVQGPRVLEVGVGTGKNLAFYPPGLILTAVDLSPRMLARSRHKPSPSSVQRLVMDVERLGFPDSCFDSVVASFLFCSVAHPVQGLAELNRVVKPDGRVLLLEHMRPGSRILGTLFDVANPVVLRVLGPNINRQTVRNVRAAGLLIEEEIALFRDIVKLLVCRKGPPSS